jgi:hypothetical protein
VYEAEISTTREDEMKYLCMVFFDEKRLEALSKSESDALTAESLAYNELLPSNFSIIADRDGGDGDGDNDGDSAVLPCPRLVH